MSDELITLVIALREAQKAENAKRTHGNMVERQKWEVRVDVWIQKYIAECVQLDLWNRTVFDDGFPMPTAHFDTWARGNGHTQTDETSGDYNLRDEVETENGSAA